MLNIEKITEDGVLTVLLDGRLDTGTTPELSAAVESDAETAEKIITGQGFNQINGNHQ